MVLEKKTNVIFFLSIYVMPLSVSPECAHNVISYIYIDMKHQTPIFFYTHILSYIAYNQVMH